MKGHTWGSYTLYGGPNGSLSPVSKWYGKVEDGIEEYIKISKNHLQVTECNIVQ